MFMRVGTSTGAPVLATNADAAVIGT